MARRLPEKNAQMHEGQWDKSAAGSHEVRGRKIGIVGYGNIGTQLSVLAENLGMAVYFYDIADKLVRPPGGRGDAPAHGGSDQRHHRRVHRERIGGPGAGPRQPAPALVSIEVMGFDPDDLIMYAVPFHETAYAQAGSPEREHADGGFQSGLQSCSSADPQGPQWCCRT